MTASLLKKPRYRTILIVITSILIIVGAAGGTILLLKRYAPVKMSDDIASKPITTDISPLKKAEALFAKGDYTGAKTQYQSILETYKSQNNEQGVKDIEMQLQVLEATAKAEKTPQNTDRTRVTAGSKP